jgi:hypothetical protein
MLLVAGVIDHALDLIPRAAELERNHPSGILNLFEMFIGLLVFTGLVTHDLVYKLADIGKDCLFLLVNCWGRHLEARHPGYIWNEIVDKNPSPIAPARTKELVVIMAFIVACPITIAAIHP